MVSRDGVDIEPQKTNTGKRNSYIQLLQEKYILHRQKNYKNKIK